MKKSRPPKIARQLFEWYCGNAKVEDLVGDLDEWFYKTLDSHSVFKARLKYWRQVISLMFSYSIRKRKKDSQLSPFAHHYFSFAIVKNYFVVASRGLYKNRYFTMVNVLGLAIGMSVSLLILTLYVHVRGFDRFHDNMDKIYRVITAYEKGVFHNNFASAPTSLVNKLKSGFTGVDNATEIISNFYGNVVIHQEAIPLRGYYTDPEFLSIFSYELTAGDAATALQKPNSIVLSESASKKLFGDEIALGKSIELSDKGTFEITGILKDPPQNSHMHFESLVSISSLPEDPNRDVIKFEFEFSHGNEYVYLLIHDRDQIQKLERYLDQLALEASKNSDARIGFKLQALTNINPGPDLLMLTGNLGPVWDYTTFLVLGVICFLILLPACFNYANISIARALKRSKEIGLRKTMGGARSQIFFQFLMETFFTSLMALLGATTLFVLIRKEFINILGINGGSYLDLSITGMGVVAFIGFAVTVALIAGVAPALYFSKLNPVQALKNQSNSKGLSGLWIRKGLTVFQFIISFGFIVTLIVFTRQYKYNINYDFGFEQENMLNVKLKDTKPDVFAAAYSKLTSVHALSFSSAILGASRMTNESWIQFEDQVDSVRVSDISIDTHFIENMKLELLTGKNFPDAAWTHEQFIIVNEEFVKTFKPGSLVDALGKTIRLNKKDLEIIGVVKNFNYASLRAPIKSMVFRMDPSLYQFANLKVSFTDAYAGISEMENVWKQLGNPSAFEANFLRDDIHRYYKEYLALMKIIGFLGVLAISISLLGMLGMIVYTTESRVKEVGIRKVMGATVAGTTFLLSKDYIKLMGWAFLVATPLTIMILDYVLSLMQYYTVQLSIWDIATAIILLSAMGLATLSFQTIKTASTNPAETLRRE